VSGPAWLAAAVAFGVSFWMAGLLSAPTSRLRLLDRPNDRSLHAQPTPRTGGVAIVCAAAVSLALLAALGANLLVGPFAWLFALALGLAIVSFVDDWSGLPFSLRLAAQTLAAVGVVYGAGQRLDVLVIPGVGTWSLGLLAVPVTVLGLVWMTNLYNFMDGMDGFAGGMTVAGLGVLALVSPGLLGAPAVLLAAATGGFLCRNFPPARIFLGDVGSVPLGFLCGGLAVLGVHQRALDAWVPLLAFSPFIVDATVTLARRAARRAKVWQAHREHYYQRLVLAGWGHRKTVVAEYVLMGLAAASAVGYAHAPGAVQAVLLVAWAVGYAALAVWIDRFVKRAG
jgi:UDP-N-acetylmuramyl pentapeptide phosphotransferase/UDP-N-acetylglucosamine-1-phosphate transferase